MYLNGAFRDYTERLPIAEGIEEMFSKRFPFGIFRAVQCALVSPSWMKSSEDSSFSICTSRFDVLQTINNVRVLIGTLFQFISWKECFKLPRGRASLIETREKKVRSYQPGMSVHSFVRNWIYSSGNFKQQFRKSDGKTKRSFSRRYGL
jgi:hypothetical protein